MGSPLPDAQKPEFYAPACGRHHSGSGDHGPAGNRIAWDWKVHQLNAHGSAASPPRKTPILDDQSQRRKMRPSTSFSKPLIDPCHASP